MLNNNVFYGKLQKSKNKVWVEEKKEVYKDRKVHKEDEEGTGKDKGRRLNAIAIKYQGLKILDREVADRKIH